jgi:cell division protein FtsB
MTTTSTPLSEQAQINALRAEVSALRAQVATLQQRQVTAEALCRSQGYSSPGWYALDPQNRNWLFFFCS